MENKTIAIIQARLTSTRFPQKILEKINNLTLIEFLVKRVKASKKVDQVIVAIPNNKENRILKKYLKNVDFFLGSEEDVLDRYFHCAKELKLDVIIRITSDCPLIDPEIIDKCVKKFENENFDYLSNVHKKINGNWIYDPCGFPSGFAVEVFTFNALENAWKNAKKLSDREHVTQYILDNPKKFKIAGLENQENFSDLRLTLDYQVDFDLIKIIIEKFPINEIFTLKKLVSFFKNYPELKEINANIPFNDGYLKSLIKDNSNHIDNMSKSLK